MLATIKYLKVKVNVKVNILCLSILFAACAENDTPFPYIPHSPEYFNRDKISTSLGECDSLVGKVALLTREQYREFSASLVDQYTIAFDRSGRCLEIYYRDSESCRHYTFSYDSLGRRTEELCYRDTAGTPFDRLDKVYTHTDYRYSRNGRTCRMRITSPEGKKYNFRRRYDKEGRVTRFLYPDGSRISFYYYADGRLSKTIYPDGSDERYNYREDGSLQSMYDRDGVLQMYMPDIPQLTHDSLNRITEELRGDQLTTYRYDDHGNWTRRTVTSPDLPSSLIVRTFEYYQ